MNKICRVCWVIILHASLTSGQEVSRRPGVPTPTPPIGIPIRLQLDRAGYVTIVIEDGEGRRVRNLAAEALLPPGQATFWWDGYDEGERNSQGDLVRRRDAGRHLRCTRLGSRRHPHAL